MVDLFHSGGAATPGASAASSGGSNDHHSVSNNLLEVSTILIRTTKESLSGLNSDFLSC